MTNIKEPSDDIPAPHGLTRGLTVLMAIAAGVAAASIYYNQPMLGLMRRDLPGGATALIPTATQAGFSFGLLLLVPLGDLIERKRLIVTQFAFLALALIASAVAPTAGFALLAAVLLGVAATAAQQIVPFAATLASPSRRGASVGMVMSGLFLGILLSRTLAGVVATYLGWRAMFWLAVPLVLAVGVWLALRLPRSRQSERLHYGRLLGSIGQLWCDQSALRVAAITQALLFAAFSAFWSLLALHLQEPHYDLGADVAGLFGVAGAVGIVAAPLSGVIADRRGPRLVVLIGAAVTLAAWVLMACWTSIAGLVVGVVLLDFGVQSALVSNQSIIYALRPDARARLNTAFMAVMFAGGAIGSAVAMQAWTLGGWAAVTILGIACGGLATLVQIAITRHDRAMAGLSQGG